MKKWILKAVVQKTISYLPFSNLINYQFQKYVTKGVYLSDEYFLDRLLHAKEHLTAYKKHTGKSVPSSCMELGTGWYPVVPVSFFLSGTDKLISVDISMLTSKERIKTTLDKIREAGKSNILSQYITVNPERWNIFLGVLKDYENLSFEEILKRLHLTYLIEDARKCSLESNSIDLINSNNTFEHIYPEILIPILKEMKRIVKKEGGVMSHFIDMSDHFAHFDKSISTYNFLQFSPKEWKIIDNSIQPQSRLRIYDYKKIYADLELPINEESNRLGDLELLKRVPVFEEYGKYPIELVAITHCHFISVFR